MKYISPCVMRDGWGRAGTPRRAGQVRYTRRRGDGLHRRNRSAQPLPQLPLHFLPVLGGLFSFSGRFDGFCVIGVDDGGFLFLLAKPDFGRFLLFPAVQDVTVFGFEFSLRLYFYTLLSNLQKMNKWIIAYTGRNVKIK